MQYRTTKMSLRFSLLINILLCAKLVRSLYNNESQFDIQNEIVEDFKRLCPYTNTCLSRARENLTESSGGLVACCRQCSCDVNCGTACCPDRPERFLNDSEVNELKSIPEQCVLAQVREFDSTKLNGKSFKMIGQCPANYSNENVREKCSQHYHDFDFEKGDFKTLMPVSVETVNVTFRNYFCAVCHNALNTKLQFWNTKAICKNKKKLGLTTLSEIPSKLSEEPFCQVIFEPSFSVSRIGVEVCEIERCNTTGRWKQYDRSLEIACLSYTSQYNGYKNIHCFFCNGHTIQEATTSCSPDRSMVEDEDSFVDLLDFYGLISSALHQQETTCSGTSIYDPAQEECRQVFCATGFMLIGNKCILQYSDKVYLDHSIVFNLRINLIPSYIARNGDFELLMQIMESFYNDLRSNLDFIQTADNAKICAMNAYLKLNDSLEEVIMSMNYHKLADFVQFISHISVQVDLSIKGIANISKVVEELAMLYTSNDFHGQYHIQYPVDDKELPTKLNISLSDEYIKYLDDMNIHPLQYIMLLNGMSDVDDGLGILWFEGEDLSPMQRCESAVSVQHNPFCPRLELDHRQFVIDIVNKRLTSVRYSEYLPESPRYITFTMMLTTGNGVSVIVCADEYFNQLYTMKEKDSVDDEFEVLSVICLGCSALSLALTFVIYCILPNLRTLPGLNTMSLVLHLFFAHTLMFVTSTFDVALSRLCSIIAVIIHYNLLASFFWMFICTFHMLKVFIKINEKNSFAHTKSIFVKYLVFTETTSVIFIICNIIVAIVVFDDSADFGYGGSLCFLKYDHLDLLVYFFVAPLFCVLLANIGMFSYVMWRVVRLPDMSDCSNKERHTVLIFAKLSSLTGITWILGFFPEPMIIKYAFMIFSGGQGVFIMLSFVLNKRVFNMLRSHFKKTKQEVNINDVKTRTVSLTVSNGNGKIVHTG